MIVIPALAAALLGVLLTIAAINLRTARRLADAPAPARPVAVSLLVPARDEARNLASTLPSFAMLDYSALEILVLDDESNDGTAESVLRAAASDPRIRLLRGTAPPPGWVGKCWACDQLARAASGEVLIFCDADVAPGPHAVTRTIGLMQSSGAGMLTALPRQLAGGPIETAAVPLIAQLPIISLLPLRAIEKASHPSLGVGNGQWLAFSREAYDLAGGHAAVAGSVLEDVRLARRAKAAGVRGVVALAAHDLSVRMYPDAAAARAGFRKNLYPLAGGSPLSFATVVLGFTLTMIVPLVAPIFWPFAGSVLLGILLVLRLVGWLLLRHPLAAVALHPVGALAVLAIAFDSAATSPARPATWKGRALPDDAGAGAPPPSWTT